MMRDVCFVCAVHGWMCACINALQLMCDSSTNRNPLPSLCSSWTRNGVKMCFTGLPLAGGRRYFLRLSISPRRYARAGAEI